MAKLVLVLLLCVALSGAKVFGCGEAPNGEPQACRDDIYQVSDSAQRQADDFNRDIKAGKLKEKLNGSLNVLISFAVYKLRKTGHPAEAATLKREWATKWNGYLLRVGRAPGDHSHLPLSLWLQEKTDMLTLILGIPLMKLTRLWDLVVLNESIPVLLSCEDNVLEPEYASYWVPTSGVMVYWLSWGGCTGLTWGAGFYFCGFIASGCEFIDVRFLADHLSQPLWNWSCN